MGMHNYTSYTWDDIFWQADDVCGDKRLGGINAKDAARYHFEDEMRKAGWDVDGAESVEDLIDEYIAENGEVWFDEHGIVCEGPGRIGMESARDLYWKDIVATLEAHRYYSKNEMRHNCEMFVRAIAVKDVGYITEFMTNLDIKAADDKKIVTNILWLLAR